MNAGLLAAVCVLSLSQTVTAEVRSVEAQRIELIERIEPSVVAVFAQEGNSGGSGVLISSDGYALTNYHVVEPCGPAMRCGLPDGQLYDAVIVGVDPTGDIALIKLLGRDDFPAATLGDSDRVRLGEPALALGNPFMLAGDFQPTVTFGIVSGIHRYQYPSGTLLEYTDCIQTDASINPGNSGGPLFDAQGRLIGVNGRASFDKRGRVNVGVAYAVSINQIKRFLGCLQAGRIVDHATLGATVGFAESGQVVVTDILETSDAWRRGLRYDDELVSFFDRVVTSPNAFKSLLGTFPAGWYVPLGYRREGVRSDTWVRLARLHSEGELVEHYEKRFLKRWIEEDSPLPGPPGERQEALAGEDGDQPPPDAEADLPVLGLPPVADRVQRGMPEAVQEVFEARRGYANYYFNRLWRNRVLGTWQGEISTWAEGTWSIEGSLQTGGTFQLNLDNSGGEMVLPNRSVTWEPPEDGQPPVPTEAAEILLATAWHWRYAAGPTLTDDEHVVYWGKAPLLGDASLTGRHVVELTRGASQARYYFDTGTYRLAAVEWLPDDQSDACWILFEGAGPATPIPNQIVCILGDEIIAELQIESAVKE